MQNPEIVRKVFVPGPNKLSEDDGFDNDTDEDKDDDDGSYVADVKSDIYFYFLFLFFIFWHHSVVENDYQ